MSISSAKPQSSVQFSVLFICLGNICRSPLAEGVFRHVAGRHDSARQYIIDSAGTGSWHVGNPPDRRSIDVAANHGIDISSQRCRKIALRDFDRFDLIIAMDRSNLQDIQAMRPPGAEAEIAMFLPYALGRDEIIPDPYTEGQQGFEAVYQMVLEASEALLARLEG